jgi:formate dehydrogenase iron-sulfur subunit
MALRGRLSTAFSGGLGLAFAAEILLCGVVPLVLLSRKSLRDRRDVLFFAALLTVLGVVYNRVNVVLFAMTFHGRMPWEAPQAYAPSIFEWGISIGLIAATIFLFGLGARLLPILPRAEASKAH